MKKIFWHFFFLAMLLFSCQNSNKSKVVDINEFLTTEYKVNFKSLKNDFGNSNINSLFEKSRIKIKNINYNVFFDYRGGKLFFYNQRTKKIEDSTVLPQKITPFQLLKVFSKDSIILMDNDQMLLSTFSKNKNLRSNSTIGFFKDTNAFFTSEDNQIVEIAKNQYLFDVWVNCYPTTDQNYEEAISNSPRMCLVNLKSQKPIVKKLNIYQHPRNNNRYKSLINRNKLTHYYSKLKNEIIYCQNCTNEIFTYSLIKHKTRINNVTGSKYKINPVYYNSYKDPMELIEAAKKQNRIEGVFYDPKNELYLRWLTVQLPEKEIQVVQIIDKNFSVVFEDELPEDLIQIKEFDGNIYFQFYNKKNKEYVSKSFNYFS